jgi:hypothetical protein
MQMPGESGNPLPGPARHRENRRSRKPCRCQQRTRLHCHGLGPAALDPVDLGDHPRDFLDPDQLQYVEMLEGLRARPVIGSDDQQYPVDRQHTGQHIGQEALMAGNIDKSEFRAIRQSRIGETQIDRQPTPLLLGQPIGIDPGQRTDQRRLAMIDMTGRRQDHGSGGMAALRASRRAQ